MDAGQVWARLALATPTRSAPFSPANAKREALIDEAPVNCCDRTIGIA